MEKRIIYQMLPRYFGNANGNCRPSGSLDENGCGKFSDITPAILNRLRDELKITDIWYTGVLDHATTVSFPGKPSSSVAVVKGRAGSPYAVRDYFDIAPYLADNPERRFEEFKQLVKRTHEAGLKAIIDFVPNHVARQYKSVKKPEGVKDLGEDDDTGMGFSPRNNFYYCVNTPFEPYFDLNDKDGTAYSECPAKATGNDHFDNHPGINDWYETVKLNYGVDYCDAGGRSYHFDPIPDTWQKMVDIISFWAGKGVDESERNFFWSECTVRVDDAIKRLRTHGL